ncbi:MAG: polysaccharide chain length determinant protein (PEP-CTERM system associated) [Bermanella sp.]|jgi:polysaccharide chain length determinant protein (PEP-CTERM system associated)
MALDPIELITTTFKDTWLRKFWASLMFVGISMSVLFVSLNWPKMYVSSAVIEVDEQNILTPLLEGSAIATSIKNHARNAQQVIFNKYAREQIFELLSEEIDQLSDKQKVWYWDNIKDNTTIQNIGSNLITISYRSADPERARLLAQSLTQLFISESVNEKKRESEGAFSFIAGQASDYHKKLLYSENALKEFRSDNLGADPASSTVVNDRILELQRSIEQSGLAINEAKIRMINIDAQLSGEAEVSAHLTREGQLQSRISSLQTQMDMLRMSYLDTYPDIVIIKDQIASLRASMANVGKTDDYNISYMQDSNLNPLFQELRGKRSQFKTELAALKTRSKETRQLLSDEKDRARQINNAVAVYAQLTRDYEGNQALYRKLLKQRESARVSMNIDIANQGLTLKIKEHAATPISPVGLRFIHFAIVGLIGALLAPFGLSFLLASIDGRFKSVAALKEIQGLPVLGGIKVYRNKSMNIHDISWWIGMSLIFIGVVSAYAYVAWLKILGQI